MRLVKQNQKDIELVNKSLDQIWEKRKEGMKYIIHPKQYKNLKRNMRKMFIKSKKINRSTVKRNMTTIAKIVGNTIAILSGVVFVAFIGVCVWMLILNAKPDFWVISIVVIIIIYSLHKWYDWLGW